MKLNIKHINFWLISVFFTLWITSCKTDNILTVEPTNDPIVAALDINSIELDGTNPNNPSITITWDEATYSEPVVIAYEVEFDIHQDFSAPVTVANVNSSNYYTWTTNGLNNAISQAGVNPFTWTTVYARVKSSIGSQNSLERVSNVVSFDVYGYFNYGFLDLYLVGSGIATGWNNNSNNPPMFRDGVNSKLYSYTGYFYKASSSADEGRFKLVEVKGLWQPQWGSTYPDNSDPIESSGNMAGNPGTQSSDPGRLGVNASGYYTFSVNMSNSDAPTYSITSFDASGVTPATSMSVNGTAVSNIALTQLSNSGGIFDQHIWTNASVHLIPGDFTFVKNGSENWGSDTSFSGVATSGGTNIPVLVEDDYEIWFNDITGEYIMIPLNL